MSAGPQRETRGLPLAVRDVIDLAWPSTCVGCDAWGSVWCLLCARSLTGHARSVRPSLAPELEVQFAEPFDGPLRLAITAFKDKGRRDARAVLVPPARRVVAEAILAGHGFGGWSDGARPHAGRCVEAGRGVVLVPIPSSRAAFRQRGRSPLLEVAEGIRHGTSILDGSRVLRHRGRVGDQSRLTLAQRRDNVAGAFAVRSEALERVPDDSLFVLFDDVVTSGATLASAHACLRAAGVRRLVCAALAATPRPR